MVQPLYSACGRHDKHPLGETVTQCTENAFFPRDWKRTRLKTPVLAHDHDTFHSCCCAREIMMPRNMTRPTTTQLGSLHDHYVQLADPRTSDWPFMGSPVPIVALIGTYLLFATRIGPWLMRDREPYKIRKLVFAYNVAMVALSFYFMYVTMTYMAMRNGQSLLCWPTDPRPTGINMFFLDKAWYYMIMKAGEMLDTLFFVLRKKTRHLSFLHLLHHSLALWSVWLVLTLGITGHVFSFPLLNSAVHIVMYAYYALSALGPSLRPKLWWKKYVTLFQIVQFTALALHALIPVVVNCGISRILAFVGALEGILFASLFTDFYYTAYVQRSSKSH